MRIGPIPLRDRACDRGLYSSVIHGDGMMPIGRGDEERQDESCKLGDASSA
jgi:hypothetical protein